MKEFKKLPDFTAATVEMRKIVAYLLSPSHPDGASKAIFFSSFGFQVSQWQELADALRELAVKSSVVETVETPHGRKYIVDGILETPSGASPAVRTVWIIDSGGQVPRLVTAFPHGKTTQWLR
jgi:hypothetical protein